MKLNTLKIDFLITQNCTYRCEYCSQSKNFANNLEDADDKTISAFLNFLDGLQERDFEVTISGGEPFCHKKFFFLTEEIIKRNGKISVVSNFSFPFESYKKLKEIAGDNLVELLVSLHLSQVKNIDDFIQKAKDFNSIKANTKFKAASVLTDENCAELEKISEIFKKENIDFELQHLRIKNSFVKYNSKANDFISKFPISKIKEKSNTYSKLCTAGVDFLFIYQNGDVYRCYSSRFNKIHSLGNLKKGIKLYKKPIPCLNKNCTCPKPIMFNMIKEEKRPVGAFFMTLYNAIFIPYYSVKNFKIIKEKLLQAIKLKK